MTRQAGALIGLSALVSFLLGLVAAGTRPPLSRGITTLPQPGSQVRPLVVESLQTPAPAATAGVDFASVAARINAAVVNVDIASRGADDRPRLTPRRRY